MSTNWSRSFLVCVLCLLLLVTAPISGRVLAAEHDQAGPQAPTYDCAAQSQIPLVECLALVALYEDASGAGWSQNQNWLQTNTPCDWYGITCRDGHVVVLDLSNNQLTGHVAYELNSMESLEILNLSHNQLQGFVGIYIGSNVLPMLQQLDISYNQLTGYLNNFIVGSSSIIQKIDLSANLFEGEFPPALGSMSDLRELYVHSNKITGDVLPNLTKLTLTQADFGYNALTPSDLAVINWLDTVDPDWAATQTAPPIGLEVINHQSTSVLLTWQPISYVGDGGFYEVEYSADFSGTYSVHGRTASKSDASYLLDGLTPGVNYFVRIRAYTPAHESQQNEIWSSYSIKVGAYNCAGQSEIPLAECQALVALYNQGGGDRWNHQGGWLSLATPCLWGGINCENGHVAGIQLPDNNIRGEILAGLVALTDLQSLELGKNRLQGLLPVEFSSLSSLEVVDLGENDIEGTLPPEWGGLPQLRKLLLDSNHLGGAVPSEFGNLANLLTLDFSRNKLIGEIPSTLANLQQVTQADFGVNALTASDPALLAWLEIVDPQWNVWQTVPPKLLSVNALSTTGVELFFEPIDYRVSGSFYEISYAPPPGETYTMHGQTPDLAASSYLLDDLPPSLIYYLRVRTFTPAYYGNTNDVWSDYSPPFYVYNCFAQSQVVLAECQALLDFYQATGGEQWLQQDGWRETDTPCSWYGVSCAGAHITGLALQANNLSGDIPEHLIDLPELHSLDLSANHLGNGVPSSLAGLANLQAINLASNRLSGEIPPGLTGLSQLSSADFGYNALQASDASLLAWLTIVDPDWMQTQTIPPQNLHAQMINASTIELTWQPIAYAADGGYYEIGYAYGTNSLYTVHGITADKNAASYLLTNLPEQTFYNLQVRTYTPAHALQPNDLWSSYSPPLFTYNCYRQSEIPLAQCEALVSLYLSTNGDNWDDPYLWLTYRSPCDWKGVSCGYGQVVWLDLDNNGLSGTLPAELGNLTALTLLDLKDNHLSGGLPPEIGNLTALEELYLSNNQLDGALPPEIGNLAHLQALSLDNNQISGPLPPTIGSLTALRRLYLQNNQITGSLPSEIGGLQAAGEIYLQNNQIGGSLPLALGNLALLEKLDLSNNQLTGIIPPQLSHLDNLGTLNLSANRLEGAVPAELSNLASIYDFDLSRNQLNGELPAELANLMYYEYPPSADFGYNRLSASDPELLAWLTYANTDWLDTQTLPPNDLLGHALTTNSLEITWQPVRYTGDDGFYEVSYALNANGPFTVAGQTADKNATSYVLSGLTQNTVYYVRLRTFTPLHDTQKNDLWSEPSQTLVAYNCLAQSQIPQTQCEALTALYNRTNGPSWINTAGWMQNNAPCTWYGVTCAEGQVTHLQLPGNRLSGRMASQLSQLVGLAELDLSNNHLEELSPDLVSMSGLNADFGYNLLEVSNPELLTWLASADPDWAQTQTVAPSQLGAMPTSLTSIQMKWQPILYTADGGFYEISYAAGPGGPYTVYGQSGGKADGAQTMEGLAPYMFFYIRMRTYTPSHGLHPDGLWSKYTPATKVYNCFNQVSLVPIECNALVALYQALDGHNWYSHYGWLTDPNPCSWDYVYCQDGKVRSLSMEDNNMAGVLPPELGNLTSLEELGMPNNLLKGPLPSEIAQLTALYYLDFSNNQLSGELPASLGGLPFLETLYLSTNQFSGPLPPEWGSLPSLAELTLDGNQLSGEIPSSWSQFPNLYFLVLSHNQLSGPLPQKLGKMPQIRELALDDNQFSGTLPLAWTKSETLAYLNLSDNQLVGTLPVELANMPALIKLLLGNNQFNGTIPPEFGNLQRLYELNLYGNQLQGGIPPELGNLGELRLLLLGKNHLDGHIPVELGRLTKLDSLALNANQLSGEIPFAFTSLQYLHFADFGYNALQANNATTANWLSKVDADWLQTQTVPPGGLSVVSLGEGSLQVNWQPILYTADGGYYEISYASQPFGPYTVHGLTVDKNATSYTLNGLPSAPIYYLLLRTFTPAHEGQPNDVWSTYSPIIPSQGELVFLPFVTRNEP